MPVMRSLRSGYLTLPSLSPQRPFPVSTPSEKEASRLLYLLSDQIFTRALSHSVYPFPFISGHELAEEAVAFLQKW